jgi:hypothetical protein
MRHLNRNTDAEAHPHASLGGGIMGRAKMPIAACAITVVLLSGASSAVAAADGVDSVGAESSNSSDSGSGTGPPADQTDANTYGSEVDSKTAGDQSGDAGDTGDTGDADETGEVQGGEKTPDDSGSDKTIDRMPVFIPEAPPVIDFAPLPEELPKLPLEPVPPPVDLPPAVPSAPFEPDPVDVMPVGSAADVADGSHPPVVTVPLIVMPVLAPPGHLLGSSIAPRATPRGWAVTSTSGWAAEPSPSIRQPATSGQLPRDPPRANVGLTARGELSARAGYNHNNLRRSRLSERAGGALPGVAGLVIITASGILLGYRQAMAGQQSQTSGADRFLA